MPFNSHFYDAFRHTLGKIRDGFREFLLKLKIDFVEELYARKPFSYVFKKTEVNEFLIDTTLINKEDKRIQSTAGILIEETKFETIIDMGNFVIKKIEYSLDVEDIDWKDRTAADTLERGYGNCADIAILLTALLRAANIPARIVTGKTKSGYHAWVQVYYDGRWFNIDPSNWKGMDKEWSNEGVQSMFDEYLILDYPDENSGDVFWITWGDLISW